MTIENRVQAAPPKQKPAVQAPAPEFTPPAPVEPLRAEALTSAKVRIRELQEKIGEITQTYQHIPFSEREKSMAIAMEPVVAEMNQLRRQVQATADAELAERRRLAAKRNRYISENLDKALEEAAVAHANAGAALTAHKNLIRDSEKSIQNMRVDRLDFALSMEKALESNNRKEYLKAKNEIDTLGFDVGVEEKRLAKLQADLPPFVHAENLADSELKQVRSQKDYAQKKAALEKALFSFAKAMGLSEESAKLEFTRVVSSAIGRGDLPRPESMPVFRDFAPPQPAPQASRPNSLAGLPPTVKSSLPDNLMGGQ